jgi:hypothetical protein
VNLLAASNGATVPAWAAVLLAVVTAGGAIASALLTVRHANRRLGQELAARSAEFDRQLAARAEEVRTERAARSAELQRQLDHERALRVRDECRAAVDETSVIAVQFRERLGAALRLVTESDKVPIGTVKPLALDRADLIELRVAEARLTIHFGPAHEVTRAFKQFYEAVKAGVKVAREAETRVVASSETNRKRTGARSALDGYLAAAQRALAANERSDLDPAPPAEG